MRDVLAPIAQFLSFDVVTLGSRLRALNNAEDKTTMVATTLLADAARIFILAWLLILLS